MDSIIYFLNRARRARERAAAEVFEVDRCAWIELAEIYEARCLIFMTLQPDQNPH